MPTERDEIRGCQRHDAASQETLYRRHWSFAMSVALRYAATRDDALETCHDAFLKVFRTIGRFDAERPFQPWFRRILVRCAIDRHRASRRYLATVLPEAEPPEVAVAAEQSVAIEADEILTLLRALPEVQRDVFNLAEVEGYTHDEIAVLLGIAPGTSRSHLTRARAALRALYHQSQVLP